MSDLRPKAETSSRAKHPIALLALATLIAIFAAFAFLSHTAERINRNEAQAERERIIRAVRDLHLRVNDDVNRLSKLPTLDAAPLDIGTLDRVLLLSAGNVNSIATRSGAIAASSDLDRSVLDFTRSIATGSAASAEGMIAPGSLFDVVAVAMPPRPGAGLIIVGLRQVDHAFLAATAAAAGVRGLQLIQRASDEMVERGSWSNTSWRGFGLLWEQSRPGDQIMLEGTVLVMAITAFIGVMIILRARREASRMHAREAQAIEASRSDWLSGLPNRVFFNHALERALDALREKRGTLALFYLDVDRFRAINDAYGQGVGDLMIQAVTRRIEAVLDPGQSLARFEGDTFSVLVRDIGDMAACERLGRSIQSAMAAPFEIDGAVISTSLSIGIAIAPDDAVDRAELIRLANLALYRAKREGRNRLAFYKPDLHEEWRRRTSIEQALHAVIVEGGLAMHYQPIVDCTTGDVVCAEALVRWNHPSEGPIAPDLFIGMAEDRGLIVPIGEWVLREACLAARQWPGIRIAVNVSPIQFHEIGFVATVVRIIEETGVDPGRLELELTEGVLVGHEAESLAAMAALRALGIRLAIDDFGTGYSGLLYLRRFVVDKIKIDRAFVKAVEPESDSGTLLTALVQLGRALNLTVTAEGIETREQRDFLTRIGCHQLQGYLIARPLPEAEFTVFLNHKGQPIEGSTLAAA